MSILGRIFGGTVDTNWPELNSVDQLDEVINESHDRPVAIYKHSTRCGTSLMAMQKLREDHTEEDVKLYYLDLLKHRDVSNAIADKTGVEHQSPQLILIDKGEAKYDASHHNIELRQVRRILKDQ